MFRLIALVAICLVQRIAFADEPKKAPTVEMHPHDAGSRGIKNGDWTRIFNDRGSFRAKAIVGETVKPGVVVSQGVWWNKYTPDGVNCNTTTSTALTDFGAGATFFDNLVEVAPLPGQAGEPGA